MTCKNCRNEKYYAGLKLSGDIIIQLPKCPDCGGYIQ